MDICIDRESEEWNSSFSVLQLPGRRKRHKCATAFWSTSRRLMQRAGRATNPADNIRMFSESVCGVADRFNTVPLIYRWYCSTMDSHLSRLRRDNGNTISSALLATSILAINWLLSPESLMDYEYLRSSRDARLYVRPLEHTALLSPPAWSSVARACALHPAPAPTPAASLRLLMLVASACENAERRQAIRDTWGRRSEHALLVFVLGRGPGKQPSAEVLVEALRHRDVVVEDFADVYENLTLKTLFLLKWAVRECPAAAFVLKADDDILVHTRGLVRALPRWVAQAQAQAQAQTQAQAQVQAQTQAQAQARVPADLAHHALHAAPPVVFGYVHHCSRPMRLMISKWYLPEWLYPADVYPDYVSGMAYVMSRSALLRLYPQALQTPLVPLEDVFLIGMGGKHLAVPRIHTNRIWPYRPLMHPSSMLDHPCYYHHMIAVHFFDAEKMRRLWDGLRQLQPKHQCSSYSMRVLAFLFGPSSFRVVPDDSW